LTAAAGRPLPVFVTEIGYPSFVGRGGVSDEAAAAYLARFMLVASTRAHIAGVWWYTLRDHGSDARNKEHHFGVLGTDLSLKPAAAALRSVAGLLAEVGRFRHVGTGSRERVMAVRRDGTELALEWDPADATDALVEIIIAAAPAEPPGQRARRGATRTAR
jgi:hypothetical protein